MRRHLGEVEDDRRPELHVGLEHAVGTALAQLGQRGLLQRLGHLVARGVELAGRTPQHPGARVLGAVDAVAEAHQALAVVEQLLDVAAASPSRFSTSSIMPSTREGAPPCSGPLIAPIAPENAAATSAPVRGDHARGEGGGVHAVLGGGGPVGVDRLDVLRVGLALPADQELLGQRLALVDLGLRDDGLVQAARRLRGVRQHHDGDAAEVGAGLLVGDVVGLAEAEGRREHRDRGLDVDADVAGVDREVVGLGGRQARGRRCRRSAGPRRSRTGPARRCPRCRRRGSAAPTPPCRARRSRSRTRRRPRVRGVPRSCARSSFVGDASGRRAVPRGIVHLPEALCTCDVRGRHPGGLAFERMGARPRTTTRTSPRCARSTPRGGLTEDDLAADPVDDVPAAGSTTRAAAGLHEPNAMVVATVGRGRPALVADGAAQGRRRGGFVFFTNTGSRKGAASWRPTRGAPCSSRGTRSSGRSASTAGRAAVPRGGRGVLRPRPRGSRLGAWASHQSRGGRRPRRARRGVRRGRGALRRASDVPVPEEWGGYRVRPRSWSSGRAGPGRMHDRLVYRRVGGGWRTERLAP